MKTLYDNIPPSNRLPRSHTTLFDSQIPPTKLNIKLKTHSLTCLDIPLETFVGFKRTSSRLQNLHHKSIAGSVDLISEIQQQSSYENLSDFSSSKPLLNIASSNQPLPSSRKEWQQVLKHRFGISNSASTHTSRNDSVARLRRSGQLQNIHQSSLQHIDRVTERKRRFSLTRNGPVPKFTFRDLPSLSVKEFEQSSRSHISPFTSLPEIPPFIEEKRFAYRGCVNNRSALPSSTELSSWKKSSSWSWKSNEALQMHLDRQQRMKSNEFKKDNLTQTDDHFRSNLPVIIESPMSPRTPLQTVNHNSSSRLGAIPRLSFSFRNNPVEPTPHRLYQKKKPLPHSVSDYEVSSNRCFSQPATRYPSTPLLINTRQKNIVQLDYHRSDMSPIATFDEDEDSDSITSDRSYCSCFDSINDLSENSITDISSSISESGFQEMSSRYDLTEEISIGKQKHTRSSMRQLCILQ